MPVGNFRLRVTDIGEIRRKFGALDGITRAEVLERALSAAAEPIVETAKSNAPPGNIRNAIQRLAVQVRDRIRRRKPATFALQLGEHLSKLTVKVGIPGGRNRGYYGLFYELGTVLRRRKSGGSTGMMPSRPFLRPALDSERTRAEAIFADEIRAALPRG